MAAENVGFEVRDCLTVVGPQVHRVWLLRRPCEAATVASQVLATETGGIWIDGCRVHSGPSAGGVISGASALGQGSGWNPHTNRTTGIDRSMAAGRWPCNLLLVHTPGCRQEGVKKVKGSNPPGMDRGSALGSFNDDGWRAMERKPGFYTDAQGVETINSWTCSSECVLPILDIQSGISTSSNDPLRFKGTTKFKNGHFVKDGDLAAATIKNDMATAYGDSGGASRFFPQFGNDTELDAWLTRLVNGPV